MRAFLGRLACRVGIHSWEATSWFVGTELHTFNRCKRGEPCRYARWTFVDAEEFPWR